jgi:RNA polymerase sigma-70 factor (ECF subfamily)
MVNHPDDLITQIQNGNATAFEKLYFNMQPRLFGFSRKFIDDSEVARDIIQEIFFEFWENRKIIIIKTSVNAYFFRILHNKCLNYIRNKKVQDKYVGYMDIKLKEAELLFFDQDQESYKSIFFKEIEDIYRISAENLPESCREIFVLSRRIGLSNKEIADQLSISVRTVENQIYRALKILKVKLKDYLCLLPILF